MPVTLVWTSIRALMPPESVFTHPGLIEATEIPWLYRSIDKDLIIKSVKKTNRLVTVEESWPFASVGSEVAFFVQNEAFDYLDAPIKKINSANVPMPYSSVLEKKYLPQVDDIISAIKEVSYV